MRRGRNRSPPSGTFHSENHKPFLEKVSALHPPAIGVLKVVFRRCPIVAAQVSAQIPILRDLFGEAFVHVHVLGEAVCIGRRREW